MSTQRELGETFTREDNKQWRIVRITKQTSLFEDLRGVQSVVEEHLLELKSSEGQVDFEVLSSTQLPYEGLPSTVKAPEPIIWRKE